MALHGPRPVCHLDYVVDQLPVGDEIHLAALATCSMDCIRRRTAAMGICDPSNLWLAVTLATRAVTLSAVARFTRDAAAQYRSNHDLGVDPIE